MGFLIFFTWLEGFAPYGAHTELVLQDYLKHAINIKSAIWFAAGNFFGLSCVDLIGGANAKGEIV